MAMMWDLIILGVACIVMGWTSCLAMHPARLYLRFRRLAEFRKARVKVIPIKRARAPSRRKAAR